MARRVHDAFDRRLDGLGWEVSHEGGDLVWTDQEDGRMLHSEPGTSPARRIALKVIGRLPVEWIL
jgi:putative cardiolipin synthase